MPPQMNGTRGLMGLEKPNMGSEDDLWVPDDVFPVVPPISSGRMDRECSSQEPLLAARATRALLSKVPPARHASPAQTPEEISPHLSPRGATVVPLCSEMKGDGDRMDSREFVMRVSMGKEQQYCSLEEEPPYCNKQPVRDLGFFLSGVLIGVLAITLGKAFRANATDCLEGCLPSIPSPWFWKSADMGAEVDNMTQARSPPELAADFSPEQEDASGPFELPMLMQRARKRRYANVLMAYDLPGKPLEYLWRAVAMVHALHKLTDHPILLLTNATHFPDGTPVGPAFAKIGAEVMPVGAVRVPPAIEDTLPPQWRIAFWKVQIWRMTEYDKLLWLDTDAILTRSLDHLFELDPPWSQKDVWVCRKAFSSTQEWPCSGLMLVKPSEATYQGILDFAAQSNRSMWMDGDQRLLQRYFSLLGTPIQLLNLSEASFGKCMGVVPNAFSETPGELWNVPAFVHKSSVKNECFYFVISRQLRKVNGRTVNVCHHHPLGAYWREMFCQGLGRMGVKTPLTDVYCDDFMWHRHR